MRSVSPQEFLICIATIFAIPFAFGRLVVVMELQFGDLSLKSLREAYSQGLTPLDLCKHLHRIISDSSSVFISIPSLEQIEERCRSIEQIAQEDRGSLWGVPFAVKDNIDVQGESTTCACPAFAYIAKESAPVVDAILSRGGIYLGKTNLDQFACGLVGTRSPYGIPENAFHKDFVPGGSSSGSAVAVAKGMVTFAFGTDTAGSGRVPAGLNGIIGMKPSVGLCSTVGVVPACRSLDCPSIFALNVEDGREILNVIQNRNPYDRTWRPRSVDMMAKRLNGDSGFTFAVPSPEFLRLEGPGGSDVTSAMMSKFDEAVGRMKCIGGREVEINFSAFEEIASLLYEGAFVAERYQGIRSFIEDSADIPQGTVKDLSKDDRMVPITRSIIGNTMKWNAADVFGSMDTLDALRAKAREELDKIDILLVPTAAFNYTIQEILCQEDSCIGSFNANLGRFTNFVNLMGMCGVSVPSAVLKIDPRGRQGISTNETEISLPFGVTLLGKAWTDALVSDIALKYYDIANLGPGPGGHGIS